MTFTETALAGAFIIDARPINDDRGFFAMTWSALEFAEHGLDTTIAQCNLAWNRQKGTLRGLHFQREPFSEVKIVCCTRGAILDVIVDLRPESPTFCRWASMELTADNHRTLYIPEGFAHGYLTLTDDAQSYYQVSMAYSPEHASGVRWDDPAFGIEWPFQPRIISPRDRAWPLFRK